MPCDQHRREPEQHRDRQIEQRREEQRAERALRGERLGRRVRFVGRAHHHVEQRAAVHERRSGEHQHHRRDVDHAEREQPLGRDGAVRAKAVDEDRRHHGLAGHGVAARGHEADRDAGNEHQRQRGADHRHHRHERDGEQVREEQRDERERIPAEQPDALTEPDIARFRGHFDQLHAVWISGSAGVCAIRSRRMRSKWPGSCGLSISAARGR